MLEDVHVGTANIEMFMAMGLKRAQRQYFRTVVIDCDLNVLIRVFSSKKTLKSRVHRDQESSRFASRIICCWQVSRHENTLEVA